MSWAKTPSLVLETITLRSTEQGFGEASGCVVLLAANLACRAGPHVCSSGFSRHA